MNASNKIRLDSLIFDKKLVPSRAKAAALIMTGRVKVDGKVVDKAGFFVKPEAEVAISEIPKYVSRGGDKLESANSKFKVNFKNKIVADVGSSTGGFTDYALQHGAKKVFAIDVGTGQLDYTLRNNPKVAVMEKTDIREVGPLGAVPDIITIDVSFISLKLVLPSVARLADNNTAVIAMAKPHFEADRATASKHKGVIKNEKIRREILKKVETFMKENFTIENKADSAVKGAKGNLERFYLLKKIK